MVLGAGPCSSVLCEPGPFHFLHFLQKRHINPLRVIDPSGGIGAGDRLSAQLPGLLDGVYGHIARAGDNNGLSLDVLAVALEHLLRQVQQTVSCGLRPGQGTPIGKALARENPFIKPCEPLVLPVHISDLSGAGSDISRRHVRVRTDIFIQLRDKALAECHHFPVRLALGVKVGTALAAADGQAREGILKNLFKAQEFNDSKIYAGVKP